MSQYEQEWAAALEAAWEAIKERARELEAAQKQGPCGIRIHLDPTLPPGRIEMRDRGGRTVYVFEDAARAKEG